jgi:AcrR family transcriptional regulator
MAAPTATGPRRGRRVDAQDNWRRLVVVAREAFAEHGANASLIDIARRAGVGSATLYRHFPNRVALLEAVYRDQVEALVARAHELSGTTSPLEALVTWLRAFAAYTTTCRGMKELIAAAYDDQSGLSTWCRDTLRSGAESLFMTARQSGAVRMDVGADQVLRLISAMTLANEQANADPAESELLLTLIIDGLRHPNPTEQPPAG